MEQRSSMTYFHTFEVLNDRARFPRYSEEMDVAKRDFLMTSLRNRRTGKEPQSYIWLIDV